MAVAVENYEIAEETFLKACILTRDRKSVV